MENTDDNPQVSTDTDISEVTDVKDESVATRRQILNQDQNQVIETVVYEAVDDSNQSPVEQFTIIETPVSLNYTTRSVVQELSEEPNYTGELDLTPEEFNDDDSSVTEEVIIIRGADDENPDDPEEDKFPQQTTQTEVNKPKRKGRKSTFELPMHVLGHDINKPLEPVVNGRALPKPRLGVKVPYRNLTSQIVSKAEIEKEIMERGRLKMEQSKGDLKFARSLTQRLAKKIAPVTEDTEQIEEEIPKPAEQQKQTISVNEQTSIQNDSDLLAILEGDGDESDMPVVQKDASTSPQVR